MTTKDLTYRRIRAEICDGNPDGSDIIDLIIDPSKRTPAHADRNIYVPATDVGYTRPFTSRIPVGYFGDNLVMTDDEVECIQVWKVFDLDAGRPTAQLANSLLKSNHPMRFAVIAGVWAKEDSAS